MAQQEVHFLGPGGGGPLLEHSRGACEPTDDIERSGCCSGATFRKGWYILLQQLQNYIGGFSDGTPFAASAKNLERARADAPRLAFRLGVRLWCDERPLSTCPQGKILREEVPVG
jgi:hypothetical protein